jgi:hypothetical protein
VSGSSVSSTGGSSTSSSVKSSLAKRLSFKGAEREVVQAPVAVDAGHRRSKSMQSSPARSPTKLRVDVSPLRHQPIQEEEPPSFSSRSASTSRRKRGTARSTTSS